MRSIRLIALLLIILNILGCQSAPRPLYVNRFGNPSKKAIIFIHGGPGSDSSSFEVSSAKNIADMGYYVITYDQRGQGRSSRAIGKNNFTYKQYATDLMNLITDLKLKNPILIGHSHGGIIATFFNENYPQVTDKIIIVSTPLKVWSSLERIRENCVRRYKKNSQISQVKFLNATFISTAVNLKKETMATPEEITKGISNIFYSAMSCGNPLGLYFAENRAPSADKNYKDWEIYYRKNLSNVIDSSLLGFVANENFAQIDISKYIQNNQDIFYGIYGTDDGLFSSTDLKQIKKILGTDKNPIKFSLISEASHNVFMDQNEKFISSLEEIVRNRILDIKR